MNNKGFAVAGILYSILILFIIFIVLIMFNLQNKKRILDKLKTDTLNIIENNVESSDECIYEVGHVWNFNYNGTTGSDGSAQSFIVPCSGNYKLEAWGAQGGGNNTYIGGYGSYSVGNILLNTHNKLSINVGGQGEFKSLSNVDTVYQGGYNGGGNITLTWAHTGSATQNFGTGGGSTSLALSNNAYTTLASYLNPITASEYVYMVAAGGGGAGYFDVNGVVYWQSNGGNAGGISGSIGTNIDGEYKNYFTNYQNANQTGGGYTEYNGGETANSSFGVGGYGTTGGGGGWYGGPGCDGGTVGGGSSYIGNSLLTNKKMVCYNCTTSNDTSTKTETNTCHNETATVDCAKEGNGYARITYLGPINNPEGASAIDISYTNNGQTTVESALDDLYSKFQ